MRGQRHDSRAVVAPNMRALRRYERQLDICARSRTRDRKAERRCVELERRIAERPEPMAQPKRIARAPLDVER